MSVLCTLLCPFAITNLNVGDMMPGSHTHANTMPRWLSCATNVTKRRTSPKKWSVRAALLAG